LSKEEIAYVLQKADKRLPIGTDAMGNAIVDKAIQHATQRVKQGMSPFYSSVIDRAVPEMPADASAVRPVQVPVMVPPKAEYGMMIAPISALNSKIKSRQKAAEGMLITPLVKQTAAPSTTQVRMPVKPKLNIGGQVSKPQPTTPGLTDLIKKTWNRYSNNGQDRTLLSVVSNFIPKYEQFVDYKDIATGIGSMDKEKINSGILGLAAPIAGKAVLGGMDYIAEKVLGKKAADLWRLKEMTLLI